MLEEKLSIEHIKTLKTKEYIIIKYTIKDTKHQNYFNKTEQDIENSIIHEIKIDNKTIEEEKKIIEKLSLNQIKVYSFINLKNTINNESKITLNIYEEKKLNNDFDESEEIFQEIEYTDDDYEEITEYKDLYSIEKPNNKPIPEKYDKSNLINTIHINPDDSKKSKQLQEKELIEKTKKIENELTIQKISKIENMLIISSKIKELTSDIIYDENKMSPLNIHIIVKNDKEQKIDCLQGEKVQILLEDGTDWIDSDKDEFTNGTAILRSYIILPAKYQKNSKIQIQYISSQKNLEKSEEESQTIIEEIGQNIEINL